MDIKMSNIKKFKDFVNESQVNEKKITVITYGNKKHNYTDAEIKKFISNIESNFYSDDLPKWLYAAGLAGVKGFPKNKKETEKMLKDILNNKGDVVINVDSGNVYKNDIIMEYSIEEGFKQKLDFQYLFQIHPRDKNKLKSGEDKHQVKVKKGENLNDVKKKVLDDYPKTEYSYDLWKVKGQHLVKQETNESLEIVSEGKIDEARQVPVILKAVNNYNNKVNKSTSKKKVDQYLDDLARTIIDNVASNGPAHFDTTEDNIESVIDVLTREYIDPSNKIQYDDEICWAGTYMLESNNESLEIVGEAKIEVEEGNDYLVKVNDTINDYTGKKDLDIKKGDTINIHDYAGPKATSLDIIVYTKNGGASKPFRMDIEDFKDLISNRDIILENKQIKMKYISEYNSTFKTFNEFLNEGKDASDILKESCDVWQKAQLDRELDFLKKGVDDTENIAADEIANIINAWIEDHTGIDMVVLKHYPETVDVKDFVTQWVMAKA